MYPRGFTLFELLITLVILALLLTIGVPSFSQHIQNTRTQTVWQDLLHSVQHARTLAVSRNRRATLLHKGTWDNGWEVFIDENDNGTRDENEPLVFERARLQGVKIHSNVPTQDYISFIGTGESRKAGYTNGGSHQMGSLRVCSEGEGDGFQLLLARGGRMRTEIIPNEQCVAFN